MKEQTGSIYIIKNTINDKVYIGQTTQSVRGRFMQHMKPSTTKQRGTYKFYNAVNKYGKDKFYVEVLESNIPINQLDEKEIAYIRQYDSCDNGYNTTYGGNVKRIHEPRDVEYIISLFKKGWSSEDIASLYGVHKMTILRTVHGSGYYVRDHLDKNELQNLVNEGLTNQEIANKLHTKKWTVQRRLHDYGIRRKRVFIEQRKDFDWDSFISDIHNGASTTEMCQKYNLSKTTYLRQKQKILNNQ